jgi:hypothetical protein
MLDVLMGDAHCVRTREHCYDCGPGQSRGTQQATTASRSYRIPVSRGGFLTPDTIVTACPLAAVGKGGRGPPLRLLTKCRMRLIYRDPVCIGRFY